MANPTISVVIPIYNEQENLPELYMRLSTTLQRLGTGEMVFVDDGSTDDTHNILKEYASRDKSIKVIRFSKNFGQHPAIKAGFLNASGEYIVLMDADLQDSPEDIVRLYQKIREGYDIVFTVINNKERSLIKKAFSLFFHFIFSKISRTKCPPNIGTFRIFSRKVLDSIMRFGERRVLYGPLMAAIGFKSCYLPLEKYPRRKGHTHYSFLKLAGMALDSLSTYTMLPLSIMIFTGFTMALLSFAAAVFFVMKKVFFDIDTSGYTSIIVAIFFIGGVILFSLGVLGGTVYRIYQEVLNRPLFLIDETLNTKPLHEDMHDINSKNQ